MFIHIDAWYIKEVYKIEDVRRVLNMGFIVMLIVGGLIGWVAGMIMVKIFQVVSSVTLSRFNRFTVGSKLLGTWGPVWGGVPIIPALIGAIIVIFVVSLILKALRK